MILDRNGTLHSLQRAQQAFDIAHIHPSISVGRQTAGQQVDIRPLATDKQDPFSRFDAGVHFRRNDVADKPIAQRNQVHVRSKQKSRKLLKRD